MKRLSTIMMCLFAMMEASLSAKAQEVTITLYPGWTWISYPKAEVLDINTALGDFVPMEGDVIKSQFSSSAYVNGYWKGGVTHFMPGWGYMYYSNRTDVVSFVFGEAAPQLTVTTAEPTEITANSAVSGGSITSNDGNYVFVLEKGICWATHPNPMVMNDSYTESGSGAENFTAEMTELSPNTVYYVRAYAVTLDGTFYGDELSFATVFMGAINGLFSISSTRQVYFSQGNLQYIGSASTPYWKFAENQWDILGDNGQGSTNQNVDRDLFGWGTSGYHDPNDPYNVNYQPWSTSVSIVNENYNKYGYGPSTNMSPNLTGSSANYDWGVYNAISNGGNQPNQWRTLTSAEWNYVYKYRSTPSGIRYAAAKVNDVNGLILLPDDWDISYYALNDTNNSSSNYSSNIISFSQWNILEQHGAVFFPASGERGGTSVYYVGSSSYYHSTSYINSSSSTAACFWGDPYLGVQIRYGGIPVRLVRDAQ